MYLILFCLLAMNSCRIKQVVPGGILTVYMNPGSSPQSSATVWIVLDTDENMTNGNEEYKVSVPIGQFISGNAIHHTMTWHAPDVPPGSYYVYAWVENDNDGILESDDPYLDGDVFVFDPSGDYSFSNEEPYIINSTLGILQPNYTFWRDSAPDIEITFFIDFA